MAIGGLKQTNRPSSLMEQLLVHPNWEEGTEERLEKDSYIIMRKDDFGFCVVWLNKQGEKVSVPFKIIDGKFCFKNGQAHHSYYLDKLISEIFNHYQ